MLKNLLHLLPSFSFHLPILLPISLLWKLWASYVLKRREKKNISLFLHPTGMVLMTVWAWQRGTEEFEQKVREIAGMESLCTIFTNCKYKTILKLKRYFYKARVAIWKKR